MGDIDETLKPSFNEKHGIAILDTDKTRKPSLNEKQGITILRDTDDTHEPEKRVSMRNKLLPF